VSQTLKGQAGSFAFIGAIGFAVDGGVLTLLHGLAGMTAVHARFVSFPVAVTVTWLLNRRHTFGGQRNRRAGREWLAYACVMSLGALLNLGLFIWLVGRWTALSAHPIVPLAMAASVALLFNFTGSRLLVFRRQES